MSREFVAQRLRSRIVYESTVELLANVDFRRLYAGRAISAIGDELYLVASMWLVYALTGSTTYTGLAGFLSRFPRSIGFLFGPLVDRARLGRLLVVVELAQAVAVLAVPVAAAVGSLNASVVLAIVPILAVFGRLSAPAQTAALPRIVDDSHLVRANSIDSVTLRAIGATTQAAAGGIIVLVGAVALFVVDSVTFLASAVFFGSMSIPSTESTDSRPSVRGYLSDVRDGFDVVRRSAIGHMVVAAALATACTGAATAVLPAFADAFGGAGTYGLLVGAMTLGALVGSLLAARFENRPFGRTAIGGFAAAAVCWFGAASVASLSATLLLFGAAWVPIGIYNVLVSATLQTGVPNGLLGRVTATVGSVTGFVGPLGALLGGYLGDVLGSALVIGASAIGFAALASYWIAVPSLRRFPAASDVSTDEFAA